MTLGSSYREVRKMRLENGLETLLKSIPYATSHLDRFLCAQNHFETALIEDQFHELVSTDEERNTVWQLKVLLLS